MKKDEMERGRGTKHLLLGLKKREKKGVKHES
jgi:hypothetical protein